MPTQNNNWFKNILQTAAYFGAYFVFAGVGSLASVACAGPSFLFRGARAHSFGQKLIRALFVFFIGYLRTFGMLEVDAKELSGLRDCKGTIVVANHPGLLDAVLVVAQLPQTICLMKGSLARNIVLSGTARLAAYVHNESDLGLIKKCAERLNGGANLLVFPEGTRTVAGKLPPFKMGFALVAILTRSPVQTVIITVENNWLGKGWPFFKKPSFPVHYSLRLGSRFQPEPGTNAKIFGRAVENYFKKTFSKK